jgi:hypothetical protein
MMKIEYKNWIIEIINDSNFTIDSTDNATSYKQIISDNVVSSTSKHGIRITTNGKEINSVVICESGGPTTIHERSMIIIESELFLCCGDHVYCLELPSFAVNWRSQLDPATCFGIYEFENDLIIHGELEISRIDLKGNKKWDFSARDIFVTPGGKHAIEIEKGSIKLRDWGGYEYVIDQDGKIISNTKFWQ